MELMQNSINLQLGAIEVLINDLYQQIQGCFISPYAPPPHTHTARLFRLISSMNRCRMRSISTNKRTSRSVLSHSDGVVTPISIIPEQRQDASPQVSVYFKNLHLGSKGLLVTFVVFGVSGSSR